MRRRLAIYGLVLGVLGGTGLWLAAPDPWPLYGERVAGLDAALDALRAGEPPLVGLREAEGGGERERFAVGTTDDQGVYLFAPVISHALGLDAVDGLKLLWVMLFGLGMAASPLIVLHLFDSLAAAIAAPIALFLAVLPLTLGFGGDIYWVPAWAALVLLPPLIMLDRDRPRWWFPGVVGLAVAASFASSLRSNAGLPIVLVAIFVVLTARVPWWKRGLGTLAVLLAYISISSLGLAAVRDYRDADLGRQLGEGEPTAHSFWHPAYLGLGYLPNEYGIYFRDDIALTHAQRENPGVRYLSREYDETLRDLTLRLVREDPGFVIGSVARKAVVVVKDAALFLLPVAILLPAFLLLNGGDRRGRRRMVLLVIPAVAINLLSPLIAIPYQPYELDYEVGLFGSLNLLGVLGALWLLTVATADPRAWRDRLVGSWRQPVLRRAAAWTVASVVAIAISAAVAGPIEDEATDWQNSTPPPPVAGG
jgi:MFS family permease